MFNVIPISIAVIGFTAIASQIVFMREFLIVFYGNELSMGIILANWLIGGAVGGIVFGRFADRLKRPRAAFAFFQIIAAILLPLNILLIRSMKNVLELNTGEVVSFFPIIAASFLILLPLCAILSFLFSLACSINRGKAAETGVSIGVNYMFESLGSVAGGLVVGFVLIRIFGSMQLMAVVAALNLLSAFLLFFVEKGEPRRGFLSMTAALFIAVFSMLIFGGWASIDRHLLKEQWSGYDLLATGNSVYGNISIVKRGGQFSFFDNGLRMYTVPDKISAEEAVHFAMLEHPDPKTVLIIGGLFGGLLEEALKHPVSSVDYVELDPVIIKMAKEILPSKYSAQLSDKRVSIQNADGRYFVKNARRKYDCVIIDVGDPLSAQINRYYTLEFFEEIRSLLKKNGIVSLGLSSSESYINRQLRELLQSVYLTMSEVFADIKIIPGFKSYFLASNSPGSLTYDYNILVDRAASRKISLEYVRDYYLFEKLSKDKVSYAESIIKDTSGARINYDFRPVTYYYDIIFWAGLFKDSVFGKMLSFLKGAVTMRRLLLLCASGLLVLVFVFRKRGSAGRAASLSIMTTGLSVMAFQMILLMSFQIIYGYVYYKLGFILTAFMIGLTVGSRRAVKLMPKILSEAGLYVRLQAALCVYPLILTLLLLWLSKSHGRPIYWFGSNVVFLIMPALAGFLGGLQFPLANKICVKDEPLAGRVSGLNYGLDLLGSAIGAIATGAFLMPLVGLVNTSILLAALNLIIMIILIRSLTWKDDR